MTLPQPLPRFPLGEVRGYLRTGGQAAFLDASGEELTASIWFVVCDDRCWLLASTGDQQWAVASTTVKLDKGWTWDEVKVGEQAAPLRRGSRKEAASLLRKWRVAPGGGEELEPEPPAAPAQTPVVARGAVGLPKWIEAVEGPADAAWLLGFATSRQHPTTGRDGTVHHEPVWMLVSDAHQVLATASGWRRAAESVEHEGRTARRDRLLIDGWTLPGPGLSDPYSPLAAAMAGASREERWALVLDHLVDNGETEDAASLLGHAYLLGRHTASWDRIGQLALANGDPGQAVQAVCERLREVPDLDLREAAVRWLKHRPTGPVTVPAGLFADLDPLVLPPGLPWPLDGALEVLGTAAMLMGRTEDGLAAWSHRGRSARAVTAMAAAAGHSGEAEAVALWREAAERWRPTDLEASRAALASALVVAPEERVAELQWRLGAWCAADGVEAAAHWRHAVVALPPPDLIQSVDGWRGVAAVAEAQEAHAVALHAWSRVWAIDAFEREAVLRTARIAEQRLNDVPVALAALEELERRTEDVAVADPPLLDVRLDIARLALASNDRERAVGALRRVVEGEFLSLEAWDRAISLGVGCLEPAQRDWFVHVRGVLANKERASHGPIRASLSGSALDALHPGGVGWLERARQSVDTASPPERAELVRGLERLEPASWPVLAAAVAEVSTALGIDSPDVYLFRGDGAWGLSAWPTEPPLILVGHDHLRDDHALAMSRPALRFALAVELTHLAAKHPLLAFDGGLVGTSRSVYEAFGKYAGTAETVIDVVTLLPGVDQLAKIQTLIKLSRRVFTARSVVDKASDVASSSMGFLGWSSEDQATVGRTFDGVALQFRLHADRSALMLTGDLGAAVEAILAGDPASAVHRRTYDEHGVIGTLELLPVDTRLRIAALVGFASTLELPEGS